VTGKSGTTKEYLMARLTLRRTVMVVCAAAFAAGILGASVGAPAGAGVQQPVTPATAPPSGGGVKITVGEIVVGGASVEQDPQPVGPLSFT